jgi:hypothetical protein
MVLTFPAVTASVIRSNEASREAGEPGSSPNVARVSSKA